MNRRNFALSWGRKMFFGLGWPLFSLIGLFHLSGQLIPESTLSIVYFVMTFIGHYGLLTSLIFFILYVPIVSLIPSYYFSRLWTVVLVLVTAALLAFDAYLFSHYRLHISPFVIDLVQNGAIEKLLQVKQIALVGVGAAGLALFLYIWIRGESLWRSMQRRFSNPVRNWYLVLILFSFLGSQALHIYGDAFGKFEITQYSQLFPFHYPATARGFFSKLSIPMTESTTNPLMTGNFHYPLSKMSCSGVKNKNILFILADQWKPETLNEELMPSLTHYEQHGIKFSNHQATSTEASDAIFSLLYSMPGFYKEAAALKKKTSVFMEELSKRNYEFSMTENWDGWIKAYIEKENKSPFFGIMNVNLDQDENSIKAFDARVRKVIEELEAKDILENTIVVITAQQGSSLSDMKVPLIMIWNDSPHHDISSFTSHYDIVPTLMSEIWECKNDSRTYSYGESLFKEENKASYLISSPKDYLVLDPNDSEMIKITPGYNFKVEGNISTEFLLNTLKEATRFYKK